MNFFFIELCQEMQKAGLVSESGFYYQVGAGSIQGPFGEFKHTPKFAEGVAVPAFTAFDLIAPTETARNNAKKWWSEPCYVCSKCGLTLDEKCVDRQHSYTTSASHYHRHTIVDLDPTKESVEDYVKRTRING